MSFIQKYRFWIAAAVATVAGILILSFGYNALKPLPVLTDFKSRFYTFSYPREYTAKEYAPGVVSIGNKEANDGIKPLIEVTRYQSDPDTATPKTFDTFMKQQAAALCGADGPVESITCTQVGVTPYTSPVAGAAQKLDLTLVRKNLKTGTSTSSTYGPFYVFNTTSTVAPTPDNPLRYSAIFISPSLPAFLEGTTSPALMDQVLTTFKLVK